MQKQLDEQVSRTTQEAWLTNNSFLIVERMLLYKFVDVNWDDRSTGLMKSHEEARPENLLDIPDRGKSAAPSLGPHKEQDT